MQHKAQEMGWGGHWGEGALLLSHFISLEMVL